jgi:hypothetical protein
MTPRWPEHVEDGLLAIARVLFRFAILTALLAPFALYLIGWWPL